MISCVVLIPGNSHIKGVKNPSNNLSCTASLVNLFWSWWPIIKLQLLLGDELHCVLKGPKPNIGCAIPSESSRLRVIITAQTGAAQLQTDFFFLDIMQQMGHLSCK